MAFYTGKGGSFRDEDEGFTKNDPARSRNYGSEKAHRDRQRALNMGNTSDRDDRVYTGPGTAGATAAARQRAAAERGPTVSANFNFTSAPKPYDKRGSLLELLQRPEPVPYAFGPRMNEDPKGFMDTFKNLRPSMATDVKLGLGSLSGLDGFRDALEGMGHEGLTDSQVQMVFNNFQQASRDSRDRQEAESMGDGDDNFYGNYDPCPEGYRTDPVTGMCVPVMGMSYETAPAAPAQYQGNFVDSPFPDLASSGPARMPFAAPMNYTQAMNYTSPTIAPSSMAAQGMGIAGIPMTPILG